VRDTRRRGSRCGGSRARSRSVRWRIRCFCVRALGGSLHRRPRSPCWAPSAADVAAAMIRRWSATPMGTARSATPTAAMTRTLSRARARRARGPRVRGVRATPAPGRAPRAAAAPAPAGRRRATRRRRREDVRGSGLGDGHPARPRHRGPARPSPPAPGRGPGWRDLSLRRAPAWGGPTRRPPHAGPPGWLRQLGRCRYDGAARAGARRT